MQSFLPGGAQTAGRHHAWTRYRRPTSSSWMWTCFSDCTCRPTNRRNRSLPQPLVYNNRWRHKFSQSHYTCTHASTYTPCCMQILILHSGSSLNVLGVRIDQSISRLLLEAIRTFINNVNGKNTSRLNVLETLSIGITRCNDFIKENVSRQIFSVTSKKVYFITTNVHTKTN